ncbi:hypothetical protein AHAS_Ahas15G0234000 [Arachis hypogaea]
MLISMIKFMKNVIPIRKEARLLRTLLHISEEKKSYLSKVLEAQGLVGAQLTPSSLSSPNYVRLGSGI